MLVSDGCLERLFTRVQTIKTAMGCSPSGLPTPVSVEDVQKAVESICDVTVEKSVVLSSGLFLHSMLFRFNSRRCVILLREDLSESIRRFATLKELSHIFLDDEEDWSTDATKTIAGLIELGLLEREQNGEHEPRNQVIVAEHLAEIAATELVYPPERRQKDRILLDSAEISYRRLSATYGAPIRAVRFAHMRWYCDLRDRFGPK